MEGILDRKTAPAFKSPEVFKLPSCRKEKLSNGIPYFEFLSSPQPALKIEFVFKAGQLFEEKQSVAFFTSKLLTSGTTTLTANEIEEKIATFGAFVELNYAQDTAGLTLYCLAKHLDTLLPFIIDLFNNAAYPEEEIENFRNIQQQNLKVNLEKTSYLASVAFKESFFGNHPYSRSLTFDSLNAVTREDVISYFSKSFNWSNAAVFVSGGGASSFYSVFDKYLNSQLVTDNDTSYDDVQGYGTGRKNVSKDSLQSSIRVGLPVVKLDHSSYYKVSFLNEVFGGYFGSRLMKNIREDKGYTYGIHSSVVNFLAASYLVVGTDVKADVKEKAIEEILKEMRVLKEEKVPADEIEVVKNFMVGNYLNSINSAFSVMDKHKTIYFQNLPDGFFENYYSSIKTVTAEELVMTAQEFFVDDRIQVVTAG